MNLRRAAVQDQSSPMAGLSETGVTVLTTEATQYERYEDSQFSRNTTGDFLELDRLRN